ncbi:PREDICTED: uncharacterized protein LOC108765352 [Trachymyrmex cornetzi]|uniref:uncharacterized protein LOC108765352 n=1 Tax=Trachymyrmex cornetzi TaxID=471704 RepID=UPI00084F673F|nr:PREDICTED: uncharacterized protein LOC108765352 [Trachymyrmex cornetzi]
MSPLLAHAHCSVGEIQEYITAITEDEREESWWDPAIMTIRWRPKTATNEDNSLAVCASVVENAHTSVRKIAQQTSICKSSVHEVLKANKFHPYKIKYVQELSEGDFDRRLEFCEEMMRRCDENESFPFWICFSDEATLQLNGEVNRHNMRYWSDENPHWMRDIHTQHPLKINVWAGILCNQIVGPFFLEDNFTAERYFNLLNNEIIPAIRNISGIAFDNVWFQQDGAPCHFGLIARNLLNNIFPGRWIGRRGSIEWPPRSPDLTPLDNFYWSFLKNKVYETKPTDI